MIIQLLHKEAKLPTRGSEGAAGYDIYMPESGSVGGVEVKTVSLGFAAEVPLGYVALLLPRSGVGTRNGLELYNTCGVIDSDYRGEWKAFLKTKRKYHYLNWEKGDRILQFIIVPSYTPVLQEGIINSTERAAGGFGSTGN